jgi:membrane protease YdiL (CAAX protease family)
VNGRAVGRRQLIGLTGGLVAVLTAWNNVVVPRLPGHPGSYVVANVAATGALLTAGRSAGLTWDELGLARRGLATGLRWGGVCSAPVAAGLAVALAIPALRPLLTDARVGGMAATEIAYRTLVRIPLGTVLWEEVAFRGVLLAALARLLPLPAATAASSAVFGVWHIRPTLCALTANDLVSGPVATGVAVLLACSLTAAAGVVFTWLRLLSGSLLAPALLHLATNSLGTLAAAAAFRLSGAAA